MSGGVAYVLDEDGTFEARCNLAMVELAPMPEEEEASQRIYHHTHDLESHGRVEVLEDMTRYDKERLHLLVSRHAHFTGSARAASVLAEWDRYFPLFRKVMPLEYRRALAELEKEARTMQAAE
jgi:glutamate synthase (NADPH/NADH) large chain